MTSPCTTSTTPATHVPIFNSYFIYFLFPLLSSFLHLYHVVPIHSGCLTTTLLHQTKTQRNLAHLRPICTSSSLPLSLSMGLWNCQSAVNKADLILTIASQTALNILVLTETWIRPEDSATPAALSNNFYFSHNSHQVRKGGGAGLLNSNYWKYSTYTPLCNNHSLESHAITVTAPVKLHVVVIYRPPGQLGTFLEELDGQLSSFPEDGSPLVVFGDFNNNLDRPYAANFHSLLASFELKRLTTSSTHKSGSQLDLIYSCNCVADNVLVKHLHTSDHYFITFNLHLATSEPPTPLPVTFRQHLCSLSPSNLQNIISSEHLIISSIPLHHLPPLL